MCNLPTLARRLFRWALGFSERCIYSAMYGLSLSQTRHLTLKQHETCLNLKSCTPNQTPQGGLCNSPLSGSGCVRFAKGIPIYTPTLTYMRKPKPENLIFWKFHVTPKSIHARRLLWVLVQKRIFKVTTTWKANYSQSFHVLYPEAPSPCKLRPAYSNKPYMIKYLY